MKPDKIKLIRLIWKMIMYKPWLYAANIVLLILVFAYNAIPSFITREFLNRLSDKTGSNSMLIWLLALILAAAAARMAVTYLAGMAFVYNEFFINALIKRNMLECILKKPVSETEVASSGSALNSFKDDVEHITLSIDALLDTIGTTVFSIIALGVLLKINAFITIFVFAPLVVVVILAKKATARIQKYRKQNREVTSEISGMLGEIFDTVQGIKVSGAEKSIIAHLHSLNKKRHKLVLKDTLFTQLLYSVYQNTVNLGTGFILLLAARLMKAGSFTVGDFALFVYYLSFVADFSQRVGDFLAVIKQSEVSFDRLSRMLGGEEPESLIDYKPIYLKSEVPELKSEAGTGQEALDTLKVRGLNYKYKDSVNGISDISFDIGKGSFTVITGRIGSGKTTLLKVLIGLLKSNSGKVFWNEKEVEAAWSFFMPPRAAYTAQVPYLFSDTVKENILLGLSEDKVSVDDMIYSSVMEEDLSVFENGVNTIIGPRGIKLSGGQLQRLAAARMFARNSQLYVMDDISSALDVETENKLWSRITKKRQAAYLVVSNKKAALQYADNIIVLKDGRIEAQGKLDYLLRDCKEFQEIWNNA